MYNIYYNIKDFYESLVVKYKYRKIVYSIKKRKKKEIKNKKSYCSKIKPLTSKYINSYY